MRNARTLMQLLPSPENPLSIPAIDLSTATSNSFHFAAVAAWSSLEYVATNLSITSVVCFTTTISVIIVTLLSGRYEINMQHAACFRNHRSPFNPLTDDDS